MTTDHVSVRHSFTEKEFGDMAREQAQKLAKRRSLEADFKEIKQQYNADIAGAEAAIERLSGRINAGWEMHTVKCFVADNRAHLDGYRLLIRLDNGHVAKFRKLQPEERQMELDPSGATDKPRKFVAYACLIVDDSSSVVPEIAEVAIYQDEWEAIKLLDTISVRQIPSTLTEDEEKTKRS